MSHWKISDYMRGWENARWELEWSRERARENGWPIWPKRRAESDGWDAGSNDYIKAHKNKE